MKRSVQKRQRYRKRLPRPIQWLVFATPFILVIALVNRPALEDWLDLVPQAPSAAIERLAQGTTMTPKAQRLFYRQMPSIESRSTFPNHCEVPEQTIVLGCYIQKRWGDRILSGKIIIQQIEDAQFEGIMEVTAAHEMLHAAYDQLKPGTKKALIKQLEKAAKQVQNQRLQRVLSDYEARDRDLYHSELHSHLGTELADLGSPFLETHYQQYFSDRQQVIVLAQKSQQTLAALDAQAKTLMAEIDQLELDLDQTRQGLERAEVRLEQGNERLNEMQKQLMQAQAVAETALRQNQSDAGRRVDEFERQKKAFNQRVVDHNDQLEVLRDRVARFNQKVEGYQAKVDAYNQVARENRTVLDSLRGPRRMEQAPQQIEAGP